MSGERSVKYPFGKATVLTPVFAAAIAVKIDNQMTVVKPATLTGAATINLEIDTEVEAGAQLLLEVKSDATARDTTLGTGFAAPVIAGVISKTKTQLFVYDGAKFVPSGTAVQID